MPQRQVPASAYRSTGRVDYWKRDHDFHGRLLKIQSDHDASRRSREDNIRHKVMPFGLKNAGVTYQRLVNRMFADKLGNMMEVYIDDMLVKSLRTVDHLSHL